MPSSAAAHGPGQEKGPQALRAAGLVTLLREAGHAVVDYGDRPTVRWSPHPRQRQPHDLRRVLGVLHDSREQLAAILAAGHLPVVLGGDCTLAVAMVSAAIDTGTDVALLYFDGGPDLRTPADYPAGILDAMGVAHLLGLPGTAPELARVGPRHPLLAPEQVCFFGYTIEDAALGAISSRRFGAAQVARDPRAAAQQALAILTAAADRFLVHVDVDVIDFLDLPAADVPLHNQGLTLADAMTALTVLIGHPGFAGLTITEFNPDHGDPDGSTARTLATAITAALAPLNTSPTDH